MTFRDKLSRFIRRWITPADAAHVVSKHGAEARRLTVKQRYDDFHARLRSELQSYGEG